MSLSLRRWCERAEFIPISCVGILHSPTEVYQHRNLKCHGFLVVGKAIFLNLSRSIRAVSCESGFWTIEKWKVKKKGHSLFSRSASEKKGLGIEIEKWKWNKNDWKSRSESVKKKLRDREVKFLENFCIYETVGSSRQYRSTTDQREASQDHSPRSFLHVS